MTEVGTIFIDFEVFSKTPKYLHVMDTSDWIYSENLPSYICITLPGSSKTKTFTFTKKKTNTFNSNNLGVSCFSGNCHEHYVDLPDGIYTITVKSSFEDILKTVYYLKTDLFDHKWQKMLIDNGIENTDKDFINFIYRIKYTMDVAKSYTSVGNFKEANKYFNEANTLLNTKVKCKNCI